MKYDVTIGIPVYRAEPYIRQTMESALSQTYPSIEFLVVDDGGGDRSVEIIRELEASHPRGKDIRILTHAQNQGVSASRNQIIDEARGDYLYFMDADDLIAENAISLLIQKVQENDAEIVFGSYEKREKDGTRTVYQYDSKPLLGTDLLAIYAYRQYAGIQASACNYLVRLSVLRDHHLRFIEADYWEDFVFTFDLVTYISRAVLLPDITYYYMCRENSLSHYQRRNSITKEEIQRNVLTIDHLKVTSSSLQNKVYYPNRCLNIILTDFYIACHVIKRRKNIVPSVSNDEIKAIMTHPATFRQICSFRQSRLKNLFFYLLGKFPSSLCVATIWMIGKAKKLL
jgi:glycosyltransferase involved in cell wall biosynthesis